MALPQFDAIVIGAGVAGLAAAGELARAGRATLLLEARDRIGGRVWTRSEPALGVPVELGAEFIHGRAQLTRDWLARAAVGVTDAAERHLTLQHGVLREGERLFAQVQRVLRHTHALDLRDVSFDTLLDRHLRAELTPEARRFARMMAQGFDAADTRRASARALRAEWSGDTLGDAPTSRPDGGYGSLLEALRRELPPERVQLRLQCAVSAVRWSAQGVEVRARHLGAVLHARARHALLALPVESLRGGSGAPRFAPTLQAKRAPLRAVRSGPVVKLLLRFATPFWETLQQGRFRDAGFFHATGARLPTFWSPAPAHAPLLVAWAGGPRARQLLTLSPPRLAHAALASLERMFGRRPPGVEACYFHDWQRDPWSRGAYSYVTVGGEAARGQLAEPLAQSLFFAGEATDVDGEAGTVTGALQSGVRAARQLLESPRLRPRGRRP
ncbi:MAG: FAD-dependent oxidoreductase [Gammaproteobacteria bacterium]|nr:FAD-dependent oxidoreductase [Gammaproteobacteria bacterium]